MKFLNLQNMGLISYNPQKMKVINVPMACIYTHHISNSEFVPETLGTILCDIFCSRFSSVLQGQPWEQRNEVHRAMNI